MARKQTKQVYYSLDPIKQIGAHYNVIFGERSNGKTSAVLEDILDDWIDNGRQGGYIRRYEEDIKGRNGESVWSSIDSERNLVYEKTGGEWERIVYKSRKWYLARWDEKLQRNITQGEPFCYAFCLVQAEHYKSTAYPNVGIILFDEFLTRQRYMINEFVEFTNLLSTIIRDRDDVKIYMLGNTVNKYCPYFEEMGLEHVHEMEQGKIDVYRYGNSDLTVAVEYCDTYKKNKRGKKSDVFFAFNNPKLQMITSGAWELPLYPHAPFKIRHDSILDICFLKFGNDLLQGDIVLQDDTLFIYFHRKTTEIRDEKLTYSLDFSPSIMHQICPLKHHKTKMAAKLGELFATNQVFYQDNTVGEVVRNYINASLAVNSTNL